MVSDTAVTAWQCSPSASAATFSKNAESTPPENATTTRPYPRSVSPSASSLAIPRKLAHSLAEVDRPGVRRKARHADHLLAPFRRAARDVPGRGLVVDDHPEPRADGEVLERQLGAHEGERAQLATQVDHGRTFP